MKAETTVMKVTRLVVVSKDFSTYYIPGQTVIVDKRVHQIYEAADTYQMLDVDGLVLSEVSKKAPIIVDWKEEKVLVEQEIPDNLDAYLVNFGNHLFNNYEVMAKNSKGEDAYIRKVTDSDLANWKSSIILMPESIPTV